MTERRKDMEQGFQKVIPKMTNKTLGEEAHDKQVEYLKETNMTSKM